MLKNKILSGLLFGAIFNCLYMVKSYGIANEYIIKDKQNQYLYSYNRDKLVKSFLNDKKLYIDFKNNFLNNQIFYISDENCKYIKFDKAKLECDKAMLKGEGFNIDEFIDRQKGEELPLQVFKKEINKSQIISKLYLIKDKSKLDYEEKTVHNDVIIIGNDITLSNIVINGDLFIQSVDNGDIELKNVNAENIIINSKKENIEFTNVKAESLKIDNSSNDIKIFMLKENNIKKLIGNATVKGNLIDNETMHHHKHHGNRDIYKDSNLIRLESRNISGHKFVDDTEDIIIKSTIISRNKVIDGVTYVVEILKDNKHISDGDLDIKSNKNMIFKIDDKFIIGNRHTVTKDENINLKIKFNKEGRYTINIYADK